MSGKTFIAEGHYRDDNGNEYMSIWTFKNNFQVTPNNTDQNYTDAKAMECSDKFRGAFHTSNRFKEGWMYNVICLKQFYNL